MVLKQYVITENQGISWAKTGSVTVDYFSTVLSASIVWRVTNHAGNFVKITFNDKVVYDEKRTVAKGSTLSGTVSVMGTFVNGGVNKITFDPDYNLFNNSQVTVVLEITGYLATFEIVLAQNNNILEAFRSGQIDEKNFLYMMNFQNSVAGTMFANGVITSAQRQELVDVFKPASNVGSGSGGSSGDGGGWWEKLFGGSGGSSGDGDGSGWGTWTKVGVALAVVAVVGVVLFALAKRWGST